jgi:hypothetical protein
MRNIFLIFFSCIQMVECDLASLDRADAFVDLRRAGARCQSQGQSPGQRHREATPGVQSVRPKDHEAIPLP